MKKQEIQENTLADFPSGTKFWRLKYCESAAEAWEEYNKIIKNEKSMLNIIKEEAPYIFLSDGQKFYYNHPELTNFTFENIIHGLHRQERFVGQLDNRWSVARHVLLVHQLVYNAESSEVELKQAIHHDDPEAILGDIPTPFKTLLPGYRDIYHCLEKVISKQFSITLNPLFDIVKQADSFAMCLEWGMLYGGAWSRNTIKLIAKYKRRYDYNIDDYILGIQSASQDAISSDIYDFFKEYENRKVEAEVC